MPGRAWTDGSVPARYNYTYTLATQPSILAQFPLYSMTESAIARYDHLRKLKLNVGRNDLRLAALALELNATIMSDNIRYFIRVPASVRLIG